MFDFNFIHKIDAPMLTLFLKSARLCVVIVSSKPTSSKTALSKRVSMMNTMQQTLDSFVRLGDPALIEEV
jgi:hypothetical protein